MVSVKKVNYLRLLFAVWGKTLSLFHYINYSCATKHYIHDCNFTWNGG